MLYTVAVQHCVNPFCRRPLWPEAVFERGDYVSGYTQCPVCSFMNNVQVRVK